MRTYLPLRHSLILLALGYAVGSRDGARAAEAPAAAGANAAAPDFSTIEAILLAELKQTRTPGAAVAVVSGDHVVYAKGFGVANVETGDAMRPEMLFRLGSTTKMFTAATLVLLAEQGKIDLAAPIGKLLPGLPPKLAAIIATQLLSHTAGLYDEAPMYGSQDDAALEREIAGWKEDRLFAEPGRIYSYSNPGYWLAGRLAERAGGKAFADQVAASVFGPVGMARTTFRPMVAMTYPLAQGHEEAEGKLRVIRPAANNVASWPAGSIYSSVNDLARWATALLNGGKLDGAQVLPPTLLATLQTPRTKIPGSTMQYGYGLETGVWRGHRVAEHNGSRSGYGSIIRMAPDDRLAVIVLANRTGVALTRTATTAMEIGLGLPAAPAVARPKPMALTEAEVALFAGTYAQGPGKIEILRRGKGLVVKVGGRETPLEKFGEQLLVGGTTRYVMVPGADGAIEFLHSGGRSWRRQP